MNNYFFSLIDFCHFYEVVTISHFMNFHRNLFALVFYEEGSLSIEELVDMDMDKGKDMNKAEDTSAAVEYT